jgi:hypothetical protein
MNYLPYNERIKIRPGEELFEKWAKAKGYNVQRFGFDETNNNIDGYWLVNPILRSLPDYVLYRKKDGKQRLFYVHVKGTPSFKLNDFYTYKAFESLFCNEEAVLRIAFCLANQDPVLLTLDDLQKRMTDRVISEWDDGKQYVVIPGISK